MAEMLSAGFARQRGDDASRLSSNIFKGICVRHCKAISLCIALCMLTSIVAAGKAGAAGVPDTAWLNRITYGVNKQVLQEYEALGRDRYLAKQLSADTDPLPQEALDILNSEYVSLRDAMAQILALRAQRKNAADSETKAEAAKAIADSGKAALYRARSRHLIRAIYSPNQLREQLVWFWMNHFNVYAPKANIRWQIADYEDRAIRPHVLGKFRDLLTATMTHPAMLTYLDNAKSRKGKINENYARELLELHTLGVDGGYSQEDVRAVARILTGVGVNNKGKTPRLPPGMARDYILGDDGFEFNPARHDYGAKKVMGIDYPGSGWTEVQHLVEQLSTHPATARHISRELATYFVSDEPPQALIEAMSRAFMASDGSIAATLKVMFESDAFEASLSSKYRSPTQFVIASLRQAYDSRMIVNYQPVIGWMAMLGQPLYGYVTPDGYALASDAWNSSGQLSQRFEVARAIGGRVPKLFTRGDTSSEAKAPPQLRNAVYARCYASHLSRNTGKLLGEAKNPILWNTLFLSSPEWQSRESH